MNQHTSGWNDPQDVGCFLVLVAIALLIVAEALSKVMG